MRERVLDREKLIRLHQEYCNMVNKWRRITEKMGLPEKDAERVRCATKRALKEVGTSPSSVPPPDKEDNVIYLEELSIRLKKSIKEARKIIQIPYRKRFKGVKVEQATLMISDIHKGRINKILNHETGEKETTYNDDILVGFMNGLLSSVSQIISMLSSNYDIEKLNVFVLGDLVQGDLIFRGQRFSIEYGVGKQVVELVADLIALFEELLKVFKRVEVTSVPGNHSRFTAHREDAPASNSFDYLVMQQVKMYFRDEKRIELIVPESWFYVQRIYNWRYLLHHGDSVYSWMSLPYYGIVRQSKARIAEIQHDMECIGHFHTCMSVPVSGKVKTQVNGAWIPKDAFAWKQFGVMSKPEQYFFGVSKKRPKTWGFELDLRG